MPNPGKKINNAPQNAQTDTGTGSPKRVYQKIEKKATPIAQKKATPRNAQTDTGTGGGKTLMKKLKKANAEGASEAGATMMKKLTPIAQKKATPIARQTTTTEGGKGVSRRGSGEWLTNPYVGRAGIPVTARGPVDHTGSYTATHAYDFYDEDHQDRVGGRENTFHSLLASGGSGGRVGRNTAHGGSGGRVGKTSDPFVEGFNSTDTSFTKRSGRRRKS